MPNLSGQRDFYHEGESIMNVGFIGLGRMGAGMAANLLKAGHDVTVYNRTSAKQQELVEMGAQSGREVADACQGEAAITMLADESALESVLHGEKNRISTLGMGAIHICMATISVSLSERLAALHEEAGQWFVAAPVFGRPDAAAAAKLFIVAAGKKDIVHTCRPLFDCMGQKTFVIGEPPPMANLVKLSGNYLIASVIEALGEAMALIGKAGIDRHQYLDILTSTLFNAPVYKTYGALIAGGKFQPAGFGAPLGYKDMRLALAAAEQLRVPMPLASLLHDRFLSLIAQGGESLDWSAIAQLAAKDAGLADRLE
jgi:3-hydroxyisobutyrate dehydrogenase-like beta-hydroxyacid dehydrogenase